MNTSSAYPDLPEIRRLYNEPPLETPETSPFVVIAGLVYDASTHKLLPMISPMCPGNEL